MADATKQLLIELRRLAIESGVAIECPAHRGSMIFHDVKALERAFEIAKERHEADEYGLLVSRAEIWDMLESVIDDLPLSCRVCGRGGKQ